MNTCTGAREHVVTMKKGREGADYWPCGVYPSCLHTTWASRLSQRSSHTVPHTPPTHTSTLPSLAVRPPSRRRSPVLQALSRSRTVGTAMAGEIRTQISHASPVYATSIAARKQSNNRKRGRASNWCCFTRGGALRAYSSCVWCPSSSEHRLAKRYTPALDLNGLALQPSRTEVTFGVTHSSSRRVGCNSPHS